MITLFLGPCQKLVQQKLSIIWKFQLFQRCDSGAPNSQGCQRWFTEIPGWWLCASKYNSITPISHFTARRWTTSDSRGLTCTQKWLEVGKSILWYWKMWSMSIMSGGKSYTPSNLLGFEYSKVPTMETELWWESCYDPLPSISRSSNVSFRIILSTQLVADSKIAKSKKVGLRNVQKKVI